MAEPHSEPHVPRRPDLPRAPEPPPVAAAGPDASGDLFAGVRPEPSDDTPTIISRNHAPLRPEEALAGVLRGRHLAHFELIDPIGVGGMAAVIRARDLQLDRYVALKILPPEMAADPENVRRFHQEARAAARLDHENIARAFFCGEDQGLHFIAFEFVEGENLRTVLERRGRLPVSEAIHYLLQVATGLAHASARGVVHRDIKPSNIIITPTGRAKLVDMGLARSLHADAGLTQSGVTLGTFDYISPEQALEPRDADVRSDIYSLGCTFYHVLTGQPSVPEGTAAKKLHHHQHVAPVDPRQFNPDIPDDVAALLARMMAKDAKDRYQRPEHLVQHLLVLAQRLGSGTEVPDGVLYVDAPLPGPPHTRPALIAAVAVLGLIVLVVLLEPSLWFPPAPGPERAAVGRGPDAPARRAGEPEGEPGTRAAAPRPSLAAPPDSPLTHVGGLPAPAEAQVESAKELADLLDKKPEVCTVRVARDLNLNELIPTGAMAMAEMPQAPRLIFQGSKLTIEPAAGVPRPVVRLTYDANASHTGVWAALTLRGRHVTLRGLRFEIDAAEAPEISMAALALEAGQLRIEDCEFVQAKLPDPAPGRLTSVLVEGPEGNGDRPTLILDQCYFASGQEAVGVTGAAVVRQTNCAFGPYSRAVVHLGKGSRRSPAEVVVHNCSGLLEDGAVFQLDDGAACDVTVEQCVFSHPEAGTSLPEGGALLRQLGELPAFTYKGARNYYHNLQALWERPAGGEATVRKLTAFRQTRGVAQEERSTESTTSPWENADPLAALRDGKPELAFQINLRLPQLRQPDLKGVLGVERCSWGYPYRGELTALRERKPAAEPATRVKVVDPRVAESGNGVYKNLKQAVTAANSGDTILVRHDGLLKVDALRLEEPIELTIKADAGHHPVLALDKTTETDAALFRLYDGQLHLERLEFHLQPEGRQFRGQAVVALIGDGQCSFKDCSVTLEETPAVPLAVVTVADPNSVMRMEPVPRAQEPRIRMEGTFVRGAGDLVAVRASRPFRLEVEDSLLALDGSLLLTEANPKDPAPKTRVEVSLTRVTSYLTDHLVWLRAAREESKQNKGLIPTQVSAEDCLFASATGKSLIHLDGVESDEQMKRLFVWDGKHNVYSNFPQMLDQQPPGDASMALPPYDRTRWVAFTQEPDGKFDRVKFVATPAAEGALANVEPGDFRVKTDGDLPDVGVNVDRLLDRLPRAPDEENEALAAPPGRSD